MSVALAVLVVLASLGNYLIDARKRQERTPHCQWDAVTNPTNVRHDQRYSARFCYLTKDTILLRVYLNSAHMVAERSYPYSDIPNFYWKPNGLGYIHDDGSGFIDIPPTFVDRLRARLP